MRMNNIKQLAVIAIYLLLAACATSNTQGTLAS